MRYILLSVLLFTSIGLRAQDVDKNTYVYSIKGRDTLRLDCYTYGNPTSDRPCMMFMFGGGFVGGTRDNKAYAPFFDYYARKGYFVVSLDYRLGLKGVEFSKVKSVSALVDTLEYTVTVAVEDLYDATNYVASNAKAWSIDMTQIVICGSSAGAISVLQGEYMASQGATVASRLPDGFRYAGVVAFAGAVFSRHRNLKWSENTAPMLLFHGDADSNVPYHKSGMFGIGMYGSEYIVKGLKGRGLPYYFCSFTNRAHDISMEPMNKSRGIIDDFLQNMVLSHKRLQITEVINDIDLPAKNKRFRIKDYLKSNYSN